ncbi:UDP-glucose 4-epimerase GalE [Neochlamydia sp. S13]|uniref:UDP-glucose 4-epimerase GalE n=1 Tax=Neochlamydia sp. S13 TaxID=1353976 RepID=UPI0005AB06B8|nr:UDP-glucose 4-epimerase GalE [Neochlamydia sp. S13]BBI18257.1 UDP-glucose 4-epimerase [Neochlamydia sp. S13]
MHKSNKKKVLVTGGAGFIGSTVNKLLHEASYDTVILDNLSQGKRNRVKWGTFIEGDMSNPLLLKKLFANHQFDAVMHFAAFINVGESVHSPEKYYINNVSHTLNLLECIKEFSVKAFIFSSSAAVYGLPKANFISEDHPTHPINPYGETKLTIEKILDDMDRAYGIKSAKLRYFNAAGGDPEGKIKNDFSASSNLIPIVLQAILDNRPVTVFGKDYPTPDGTCLRDYIHIYDLATAHIRAMEKLLAGGPTEIYNLGNGKGFSVQEVLLAAEKVTKQKIQVIEGPRRPGDPPCLLANAYKAKQELNWQIKYPSLEEMIYHAWTSLEKK